MTTPSDSIRYSVGHLHRGSPDDWCSYGVLLRDAFREARGVRASGRDWLRRVGAVRNGVIIRDRRDVA